MAYFDSAYIAKFYLDEPESDAVRELARSLGQVQCAVIGRGEVAAVFHRKWREGAFGAAAHREIAGQFTDDSTQGLWTWLPVTPALAAATAAAIERLPRSLFLRSADALHLVCAKENGFREVYGNDRRMAAAARHLQLRAVTVDRA